MTKISINLKDGTVRRPKQIYGIDLGTTNSLVAYIKDGKAKVISETDQSSKLMPSLVYFSPEGDIKVGDEAQEGLIKEPARTVYSAKRLMGKSYVDLDKSLDFFNYKIYESKSADELVKVQIDDRFYSPIQLSAEILRALKQRVQSVLGQEMEQVVITVPAYFNDVQRQATRDAGKLAGLDVMRIVNEPTAAALAYGLGSSNEEETVAVYDLGGGTFDVTILEINKGIFHVLSTNGNTFLGGDDIDQAILDHWQVEKNNKMRLLAKRAKESLSTSDNFSGGGYSISRKEFELLIEPLIKLTLKSCQTSLSDAQLTREDINQVILVGGSTRIPYVKEKVGEFFDSEPHAELDPDEVVAIGAAVQADILGGGNKDFLLLDVTPLSLGIETVGGLMDVIITRNSKIPTKVGRQYTTSVDGQVNLKVSVYQGERDLVLNNRKLGEFILSGIPPMAAGIPKIQINFLLDADGILRVEAQELRSGVHQEIDIRPSYGISEEEMAKMLIDSLQNAEADSKVKMLKEAQNEIDQLLLSAAKFKKQNAAWLSEETMEIMNLEISKLRDARQSEDKDLLQKAITDFDSVTRPLAEMAMDMGVKSALSGTAVDE